MQHVFKDFLDIYESDNAGPKVINDWNLGDDEVSNTFALRYGLKSWSEAFDKIERLRKLERQFATLGLAQIREEGSNPPLSTT